LPATQSTQLVRAVAASSWTAPVTAFAAITTGVPLSSTVTAAVVSNTYIEGHCTTKDAADVLNVVVNIPVA
jgi:hypothetical protein